MSNITEKQNFKVVIGGAFLLACNAGYIGALSLAGLHSATVTHVTGNVARTSIFFAQLRWFDFARMFLVSVAFIGGSMLSAIIVSGTKPFDIRRTYGWALLLESTLLFISYAVSNRDAARTGWWWSEYFAAMACGLQNALCTSYSGAMIRTTHMTGCLTDIGIAFGQEVRIRAYKPARVKLRKWWRNRQRQHNHYETLHHSVPVSANPGAEPSPSTPSRFPPSIQTHAADSPVVPPAAVPDEEPQEPSILWRLKVLIPLVVGYSLGAIVGAETYLQVGNEALLVPSIFIGLVGFVYALWTTFLMTYRQVKKVTKAIPMTKVLTTVKMNGLLSPLSPLRRKSPDLMGNANFTRSPRDAPVISTELVGDEEEDEEDEDDEEEEQREDLTDISANNGKA